MSNRGPNDQPSPYLVFFYQTATYQKVVAEVGEDEANGNPDYYYERQNFETLAGARRLAETAKVVFIVALL